MSNSVFEATFHHSGFTVPDLERAVQFYQEVLGFEHERTSELADEFAAQVTGFEDAKMRVAFIRLGGLAVELLEYKAPSAGAPVPTSTRGHGHLCLRVKDIKGVVDAIEQRGGGRLGRIVTIPRGPNRGSQVVYMRDPNGVVIELLEPSPVALA